MRHPARYAWFARIPMLGLALLGAACVTLSGPARVSDEARIAGRGAASFPPADEDYFRGMDGGIGFTPAEIRGRNTWLVWTGGNDQFWDKVTGYTFGTFDLLEVYRPIRV
jgi:hypothetical protein